MIWVDLIYNLALLVALSVVSGFVEKRWRRNTRVGALLQGVVFGGAAVVGMLHPFVLNPGLIFDGRSVMISLGAFFFGPWAAAVACLMTIPLRVAMGGAGVGMGVLVILVSAVIGVAFQRGYRRPSGEVSVGTLLAFGLVVHLGMLAATVVLPSEAMLPVLRRISGPVLVIYPLATVLIGKILSDQAVRGASEESLAASQRMIAEIINAVPVRVFWKDRNLVYLGCNAAFARDAGFAGPEDIIGKDDYQMRWREQAELYRAADREVIESGRPKLLMEEPFLTSEGATLTLLTSKAPLHDSTGAISGVVGAYLDITERKRMEQALRDSEEMLKESQRIACLGSYSLNISTGMWQSSGVLDEVFGIDAAYDRSVEGWLALVHPGDRAMMTDYFRNEVTGRGRSFDKSYRIIRQRDQAERWVHGMGKLEFDAQGRPGRVYGIIQDITERRRLEQERTEMEAQLRQQQKLESIGTLAGGVAHEINNPIMGIMNYAQLVADQAAPGSPAKGFASEIIRETERVAAIVKNLLQFARRDKHTHSPARLRDIVEQTLSLVQAIMRHDQVDLRVRVPFDLPAIKCRSQQIQQVLMNLLTNARDALNEKYPGHHADKIIEVTGELFLAEDRRWLRLTVEDHGNGIPETVRGRVLDPFFTTKPRDKGTGLGLSISHSIVKEHHGQLRFETEPGRFTRFHVELPVDNGWELKPDAAPAPKAWL